MKQLINESDSQQTTTNLNLNSNNFKIQVYIVHLKPLSTFKPKCKQSVFLNWKMFKYSNIYLKRVADERDGFTLFNRFQSVNVYPAACSNTTRASIVKV